MLEQTLRLPCGATLANRIVKSAMSEALADAQNNPTRAQIDLYRRWSHSGAALLITGHTPVDRWHLEHAANAVLDAQSDLAKFTELAKAGQEGGAKILVQLAHAGRQVPKAINPRPLSLSDLPLDLPGYGKPRAATDEDLNQVIEEFATSARIAQDCGFDGVEIHAAHGYLLSSALSGLINTRKDDWGGSLDKRARLPLAVIRAVRAAVGPDFIVAVKLNSADFQKGGFSPEESLQVAQWIGAAGVDFLELSGGTFETPTAYEHRARRDSTIKREAFFLSYAARVKDKLNIPVMVTGGFRSARVMETALTEGKTDLIGMGRPFIIDAAFPKKLLSGETNTAPAPEWDFPDAAELPRGAVLNWFCHQLALQGRAGNADMAVDIVNGHEAYLADIDKATDSVLRHRIAEGYGFTT